MSANMSQTPQDDGSDHSFDRTQLCSHDLQLDNSEWPDSNTLSQLSPVSSADSLTELPTRAATQRMSLMLQSVHNKQESSAEVEHQSSSTGSSSILESEHYSSSTSDIDLNCAESLTAQTEYVQPGADPFGQSTSTSRYASIALVVVISGALMCTNGLIFAAFWFVIHVALQKSSFLS